MFLANRITLIASDIVNSASLFSSLVFHYLGSRSRGHTIEAALVLVTETWASRGG
jgi:hypothetical protein